MARVILIECDFPGCGVETRKTTRADTLQGWLARRVVDTVKKTLATGVQDFDGTLQLYYCPKHARSGELVPPLHEECAQWLDQAEDTVIDAPAYEEPATLDPETELAGAPWAEAAETDPEGEG